ncbi:MAG: OmpA family protein, partial [Gammaproteobacteria bacterium]|nr:OmpA family protein [Gammaproteobacteria bacterium]
LATTHVDPEGTAFGWSTSDHSDSGYKLLLGWHFKPRLFGELSYADLGEAGLSNSDPAITGNEKISYEIPGVHVGYYFYEPEAGFNIYAKIGVSSIDNEATTSRVDYEKQNSVGVSGGLGLQWRSSSNGLFARLAADFYDRDASSIGFSLGYYFGGSSETRQAAVDLDSDADGVMDSRDSCPDSALGAQVDASGCAIVAVQEPEPVVAEIDSDADGVVDSLDACPDTEKGAQVDAGGCVALVITQINLTLEGVFFATNSAELTAEAQNILDKAVVALKASPVARVEVQAYTDNTGEAEYNQKLSTERAENVRNYLISNGIASERLTARGYGELKPKASNETREGRARNRRVEFKVIE